MNQEDNFEEVGKEYDCSRCGDEGYIHMCSDDCCYDHSKLNTRCPVCNQEKGVPFKLMEPYKAFKKVENGLTKAFFSKLSKAREEKNWRQIIHAKKNKSFELGRQFERQKIKEKIGSPDFYKFLLSMFKADPQAWILKDSIISLRNQLVEKLT